MGFFMIYITSKDTNKSYEGRSKSKFCHAFYKKALLQTEAYSGIRKYEVFFPT